MKKRILSIFITAIVLLPFILSASALSDDEALVRKRAYYAGIESSLSLLSRNLGTLENVQIQKIVVRSPKDLTTETDVKEFTVSQSQKDDSLLEILSPSMFFPSESMFSLRPLKMVFNKTIFSNIPFPIARSLVLFH